MIATMPTMPPSGAMGGKTWVTSATTAAKPNSAYTTRVIEISAGEGPPLAPDGTAGTAGSVTSPPSFQRLRRRRSYCMPRGRLSKAIILDLPLTPREIRMTTARFERSRDALVKDFSDVLAEAETLLKQAAKESGEKATDLRTQVEAKLRAAKLRLMDLQDDAIDTAKAAAR